MPIYEYRCQDCEAEFEAFLKTSTEKVACEKCGSATLEKLLSTFSTSGDSSGETTPPPGGT